MTDLEKVEQRVHDTSVSLATLAGEFKGFREDLKGLVELVTEHAKQSAERHVALTSRVNAIEGDVNTAKKGIKAVFDKVWPIAIAALLGALASRGIISDNLAKDLSPKPTEVSQSK